MNTSRKLLLSGVAAIALATASQALAAGNTATTSASASVTVFQPISVTKGTDLAFGRVIRPSTGNTTTYTVDAASGSPSVSGGDGVFTAGGGSVTRAAFTVHGEGGQGFTIASDATVVNGGVTINLVKSGATGALDGALGATGTATFGVGGYVVLSDTSPTGAKIGTFNVTVTYQ